MVGMKGLREEFLAWDSQSAAWGSSSSMIIKSSALGKTTPTGDRREADVGVSCTVRSREGYFSVYPCECSPSWCGIDSCASLL